MRQEYEKEILQQILDQYEGLGKIESSKLFTSGLENSNQYCKTESGEYVIKIYEGQGMGREVIDFEVKAMYACYQAGTKTPHIYKNKIGSLTTEWKTKSAIVMDFIDGENGVNLSLSDTTVRQVGEETAKIANALSIFKDGSLTRQDFEFDGKNFLQLESKISHLPDTFDRTIFVDIFDRFRKIQPILDKLPTGLIHNDVASQNLLIKNDELAGVIDFSDMAFSPYIQDLSVAMSQIIFSHNWKPYQAKLFVQGYKKHHDLSETELDVLYDYTLSRYAIFVIEINYWNVRDGEDAQRTEWVLEVYGFLKSFLEIGKDDFNKLIKD